MASSPLSNPQEVQGSLRICYIGWGHSIHTIRWAQWFANRGHEVHLITHVMPAELEKVNVHHLRQPPRNRYLAGIYYRLYLHCIFRVVEMRSLVRQVKPDVLHLQNGLYPHYLGVFTGFHPLVFTGWDGDILWPRDPSWLYKIIIRHLIRNADLITANSEVMHDKCVRLGADPSKVKRIQCPGADITQFSRQGGTSALRDALEVGEGPVVLSARSLNFEHYNIDVVIRSIPLVLSEFPAAKFVFIWHAGSDLERVGNLMSELDLQKSTKLVGHIGHHLLPQYYNISDVFVSVSSYDSCPQSMLEAMACEVPLVMGDIPAIREWIEDGYNGCLVPIGDHVKLASSIVELLRDKSKRKLFAERNLELVRTRADYNEEMSRMEELYFSLVERN